MEDKYTEIQKLYEYCVNLGIETTIEPLFDGYIIRFEDGRDIVQHQYSYLALNGYVEPAMGCNLDYHPVTLDTAKQIVHRAQGKSKSLDTDIELTFGFEELFGEHK